MEIQKAANRMQTPEETRVIVKAVRTLQYRSINLDLIYGLPKQMSSSFARTVDEVITLQPDRFSVFSYAHLPRRFMPQRRINADDLPGPGQKLEMLQRTIEQLATAGYYYIGMDHFALPNDKLVGAREGGALQRNFQGYAAYGYYDLVDLGVSAASQTGGLYSQNNSDINGYQTSLDNSQLATRRGLHCSNGNRVRRAVIQQLICYFELAFEDIETESDIDFRNYFAKP